MHPWRVSWLWFFNYLSIALLGVAALRWGAGPERICATALVLMTTADPVYHALLGRGTIYASVDVGHLVIDSLVAVVFVGVALQANRVYPLWLSGFQLLSVVSHFAREMSGTIAKLAYALMNYVPYYLILLILAAGIWRHSKRWKRYGPYRSWRTSSVPSPATLPSPPPAA